MPNPDKAPMKDDESASDSPHGLQLANQRDESSILHGQQPQPPRNPINTRIDSSDSTQPTYLTASWVHDQYSLDYGLQDGFDQFSNFDSHSDRILFADHTTNASTDLDEAFPQLWPDTNYSYTGWFQPSLAEDTSRRHESLVQHSPSQPEPYYSKSQPADHGVLPGNHHTDINSPYAPAGDILHFATPFPPDTYQPSLNLLRAEFQPWPYQLESDSVGRNNWAPDMSHGNLSTPNFDAKAHTQSPFEAPTSGEYDLNNVAPPIALPSNYQYAAESDQQWPASHQSPVRQVGGQVPRRSTNRRSAQPRVLDSKVKCAEEKCSRGVKIPSIFCKRHQDKFDRNNADPPQIEYLEDITSEVAREMAYPTYQSLAPKGSDKTIPTAEHEREHENRWVRKFLSAASEPVSDFEAETFEEAQTSEEAKKLEKQQKFEREQQKTFNGKARMEGKDGGRYTPEWINARMRMLFQAVLVFHRGGRAVYPVGGDNGGYGKPDTTLNFEQRLERLEESMRYDKLTVMNVIEGRGVVALVHSPARFQKRKAQNKQSNEKKDRVLQENRDKLKEPTPGIEDKENGDESDLEPEDSPGGILLEAIATPRAGSTSRKRQREPDTPPGPPAESLKRLKAHAETMSSEQQSLGNLVQPTGVYPTVKSGYDSAQHEGHVAIEGGGDANSCSSFDDWNCDDLGLFGEKLPDHMSIQQDENVPNDENTLDNEDAEDEENVQDDKNVIRGDGRR